MGLGTASVAPSVTIHEKNKTEDFWKPLYFVPDQTMPFRSLGSISPGHRQEATQYRSRNFMYNKPLSIADFVVVSHNRVKYIPQCELNFKRHLLTTLSDNILQ